ncbi:unnamed protein product, partial [Ixodes pacificus]
GGSERGVRRDTAIYKPPESRTTYCLRIRYFYQQSEDGCLEDVLLLAVVLVVAICITSTEGQLRPPDVTPDVTSNVAALVVVRPNLLVAPAPILSKREGFLLAEWNWHQEHPEEPVVFQSCRSKSSKCFFNIFEACRM